MTKAYTNFLIALVAGSRSAIIEATAAIGCYVAVRRWRRQLLRSLNRRRKC